MLLRRVLPVLLAGTMAALVMPAMAQDQRKSDRRPADPIKDAEAAVEKARAALERAEAQLKRAREAARRRPVEKDKGGPPWARGGFGRWGKMDGKKMDEMRKRFGGPEGKGDMRKEGRGPFGGKGAPMERLERIEQTLEKLTREVEQLRKGRGGPGPREGDKGRDRREMEKRKGPGPREGDKGRGPGPRGKDKGPRRPSGE